MIPELLIKEGGYVKVLARGGVKRLVSIMLESNLPITGSHEKLKLNAGKI